MLLLLSYLLRHFKTRDTYGYQMITTHPKSLAFLKIYHDVLRPIVTQQASVADDDLFLVNFLGEGPTTVSRYVSEYFQKHADLLINTNIIRSVYETTFDEMHARGTHPVIKLVIY